MQETSMRMRYRLALAVVCAASASLAHADWVVAQVAPLTGATAVQSKAYAQGMRLYFNEVNKSGGVRTALARRSHSTLSKKLIPCAPPVYS